MLFNIVLLMIGLDRIGLLITVHTRAHTRALHQGSARYGQGRIPFEVCNKSHFQHMSMLSILCMRHPLCMSKLSFEEIQQ